MLTKKQKGILDYIISFTQKKGYSPTLEEISQRFKLSSVSTAHFHIKKLEDLGYVSKTGNLPRSITVTGKESFVSIPLLGTVVAGYPIEAQEEKESVLVPMSATRGHHNIYALRVHGESMRDENIFDGDIVLIEQKSKVKNGERAVILIDQNETTLKKFYEEKNMFRLEPANKNFSPIIIKKGTRDVSVQGSVIEIIRNRYLDTPLPTKNKIPPTKKLPLNKTLCGDAVSILQTFPDNSIDIVITSPPYDSVRDYKGFTLDLHGTGQQLHRVLKDGGIVAMVIQDQTKNFGKSLTSFRTILDWCDSFGFKLFETVIYRKYGAEGAWWNKRFRVDHEYIPIFLKGDRPRYFNKEHLKIPSKHGGKTMTGGGTRLTNGVRIATRPITINPTKCRGTIWEYLTAGDGSRLKHQHPATFPNRIPYDFIQCFCPKGGIVLDPFVGSGTTLVAAKNLGHPYIGIDIAQEYCAITKQRLKEECSQIQQVPLF